MGATDIDLQAAAPPAAEVAGPPLFVVINGGSGKHDLAETRETLARLFGEAGRAHGFIDIQRAGSVVAAAQEGARKARESNGVVVAVGGDGTLNAVAQAAWKAGCTMGVLPQGTFNLFGREHGISQDLETAARALLRARPAPVQISEVNGRMFLVNASVGLYPQLLQDREQFKKQFGRHRWVAILSGLVTLFEWRRQLKLEIDLDGEAVRVKTPTLFVGNNHLQLSRLGLEPEVVARVGEGRLAAVMPRPIGTWTMVWLMLKGAFGRLGEAEQVHSFPFRKLTVDVLGNRKVTVATDGEVGVLTPPLHFAVAATPLQLMLPREEDRVPIE